MHPSLPKHQVLCFFVMTFLVCSVPDALADLGLLHPPPRNRYTAPTLPSFSSLQLCVKCLSTPNHRTRSLGRIQQAQSDGSGFAVASAYIWALAAFPVVGELVLLVGNAASWRLRKGQFGWGLAGIVITALLVAITIVAHIGFSQQIVQIPLAHLHFVGFYALEIVVMTLSILNLRAHIQRYGIAFLPWINIGTRGDLQTGLSFSTTF